jgi:hypothetical protein
MALVKKLKIEPNDFDKWLTKGEDNPFRGLMYMGIGEVDTIDFLTITVVKLTDKRGMDKSRELTDFIRPFFYDNQGEERYQIGEVIE